MNDFVTTATGDIGDVADLVASDGGGVVDRLSVDASGGGRRC